MENKREHAHDIAEEGLDKLIEGYKDTGEKLIDQAKKIFEGLLVSDWGSDNSSIADHS